MGAVAQAAAAPPLVLSIDVGSSSVRAGVYDARGEAVAGASQHATYTAWVDTTGAATLDAEALLERVTGLLDTLQQAAPASLNAVAGVAISTFWHSLLGCDADGRPLTPLLLWADRRAAAAATTLQHELDESTVHARTGCRLHWSYWPARLRWLQTTQPALVDRVRRWVGFGDYLAWRLFGAARASLSMVSATGLLDQHTRAWDPALLAATDLPADRLPEISDEPLRGLAASWAARWPALARVPWWPAWGDGACSNVGCGALGPARRALMIGTSGALRAAWAADDLTIPPGVWAYRIDARRVVMGGALNDGGNLLAWLRATLGLAGDDDWLPDELVAAVAALPADGHGLTVLPLWGGERSPGWAADAHGAIVGLSLATSPAELVRATLEAVALRFALLDRLLAPAVAAAASAGETEEVVATGGALLRLPLWQGILADALGRPLTASPEPEASSRGAALLALEKLGAIAAVEAVPAARGATYRPDAARHARYGVALARQQLLYRLLVTEHGGDLSASHAQPSAG